MTIYEKLNGDLKEAMKSGNQSRRDVIRFMLSGVNAAQKEKQVKEPGAILSDEEVVSILQKDAKRRKDAVELFRQGKRDDLVEKEEADLAVIAEYLPEELSRQELEKMIDELKAKGFNDFKTLMQESMKLVKGRADGKLVGEVIKEKIG